MESVCPGCNARLPAVDDWPVPDAFNASRECFHAVGILTSWTQTLGDEAFPHQHVVDAYAAQHATRTATPIRTAFALIGLHLACDRGVSGVDVQRAHMRLAQGRRPWPAFEPRDCEGTMTVADVLAAPDRIAAIHRWAASVWAAWEPDHAAVWQLASELDHPTPHRRP
ncbi:MAG TPA: DUF5946 family protein [Myxococcales bacterium]|nr:DUF5946 family protein [Myxococcales bacterium]